MKRLILAWRLRRARRAFDFLAEQGEHDWIENVDLSRAEKPARFEALHPEATRGPSPFVVVDNPATVTAASTVTYRMTARPRSGAPCN